MKYKPARSKAILHNAAYICKHSHTMQVRTTISVEYFLPYAQNILDTWMQSKGFIKNTYFECKSMVLISRHHVCDGIDNCMDGEDEEDCDHVCEYHSDIKRHQPCIFCHFSNCSCSQHYFQCTSGGCIPVSKVCDCLEDCHDHSDEIDDLCPIKLCDVIKTNQPHFIQFLEKDDFGQYNLSNTICIGNHKNFATAPAAVMELNLLQLEVHHLCNKHDDCFDGEDEWGMDCDRLVVFLSIVQEKDPLCHLTVFIIDNMTVRSHLRMRLGLKWNTTLLFPPIRDSQLYATTI